MADRGYFESWRDVILTVVFVVLMMFWLFSGYVGPGQPWGPAANTFIPWLCVAILGWIMFGGGHLPR